MDFYFKYTTSVQFGNTFLMVGGRCSSGGDDCQRMGLRSIVEYVPDTETFIRRSEKLDVGVGNSAAVLTGMHFTTTYAERG